MQVRPGQGEGLAGGPVAGVLDRHPLAGADQQLRAQADALLGAAGDHDLRRVAVQAAAAAQIGRDQLAQRRLAGRVAVAQPCRRWLAPEARRKSCPGLEGKQVEGRHAHAEGARRAWWRCGQVMRRQMLQRRGRGRVAGGHGDRPHHAGQFSDVGAGAYPPLDIALGVQLVEGAGHGIARQVEQAGQLAAGRQARASGQAAVEDALAQSLVQLAGEPLARIELDAGKIDRQRRE
ncbi:hypothetical protein D3C84_655980 [compost metagenome]